MARVLVLSFSELADDPRVSRQIRFLTGAHEVVAAGLAPPADPVREYVDLVPVLDERAPERWARRLHGAAGAAARRFAPMHWGLPINRQGVQRLRHVRPDVVLVNDVNALPLGFAAARGAPVVLDAHEHAPSEYGGRKGWQLLGRPYAEAILRALGPRLAGMTTVSPGIARAYADEFGVEVGVLTNAPFRADLEPSPVADDGPLRVIHHGVAAPRRHLEILVEAARPLEGRIDLTLMLAPNDPDYVRRLEELSAGLPHVRVVGPAPYAELIPTLNPYDVGVHVIPDLGTVHEEFALPNKVFEFVQARLALVLSPSPDMRWIATEHGCGVLTDGPTPEAVRRTLAALDADQVRALKAASHRAADVLCAENNRQILLDLVEQALRTRGAARASG